MRVALAFALAALVGCSTAVDSESEHAGSHAAYGGSIGGESQNEAPEQNAAAPSAGSLAFVPTGSTITPPSSGVQLPRPAPHAGYDTTSRTLTVGTQTRTFTLVVPGDYDPNRSYPLVLALHGDGDTGAHFQTWMTFESASKSDAIVAYPSGQNNTWNLTGAPTTNNDIQFILAIIGDVAKTHTTDTSRVFATGFSSGAFMSNFLACHAPQAIRAIASNSGGAPYDMAQTYPNGYTKCAEEAPVAALHVHGSSDTTVTPDSGRYAAQYWAYVNGCGTTKTTMASNSSCVTYAGCPAGKNVVYCEVSQMGHTEWNQTAPVAWTFFKAQ